MHYVIDGKVELPTTSYVADPKERALLWHRRMAHLGWEACAKLPELCEGVNVTPAEFRKAAADDCDICIQSKLVRAPFPSSERSTRAPLERVHCDLLDAGSRLAGVVGFRYGLTVLDEHTGLTIVHVLRAKDEAWGKLTKAVAWLERQCGRKVKALRVDRGGEFVSQESLQWLRQKGIMFEPTAPHSPQQNGMAERLNRVFVERVRAMLADSGLPHKFWFFAFQYANEVRNRSIYAPLGITPYEAFFDRKPDVSRLRVWGCQVYYLVLPKEARGDKFSPVSQSGWFMGLDGGGYRILTTSGSTVVAHTVKCLERTVTSDAGDDSGSSGSAAAGVRTGQPVQAAGGQQPVAAEQQRVAAEPPVVVAAGAAAGAEGGEQGVPPAVAPLRRSNRATKGVPPPVFEPGASSSRVQRQPDPLPFAVRLPVVTVGVAQQQQQQQQGAQQQGAEAPGDSAFRV
jgi:transposase InsO family protein